ncbi:MAG: aspartate-semialdehyde dehydrogenase [Methanospirillum sp.]|nr:aspartate-semialdehyde dehydrogenase [Methanospirillum sp.]
MINVGVLGATGAVGQRFVQLLADHPWFRLTTLTASGRSEGRRYSEAVDWRLDAPFPDSIGDLVVSATRTESLEDCDLVFSALPAEIAGDVETSCAQAGLGVCTNASSHRMEPDVPLIVPEVNPEHLALIDRQRESGRGGFIVTNPNCSTIIFTLALAPLRNLGFSDVRVATMQAISGAGFAGVPAMAIYDNVVPFIGGEEEKMESETLKIMGTFDGARVTPAPFSVSASCHRVPVVDGHTLAIWCDVPASPEEVREAFRSWRPPIAGLPTQPDPAIQVFDEPNRPQPRLDRMRGRGMTVSVGRIRPGLRFIALGHNTIRGAAGASVLNAELIVQKKYL